MTSPLTVADAISTITHSSLLTVITEGKDDYTAFRYMESRLSDLGVSFLPLVGRDSVLQVWAALGPEHKARTICLVDKDSWVYEGVPAEYQAPELLTSHGYSIENDLFNDGFLIDLCMPDELERFDQELDLVCRWHAPRILAICSGISQQLRDHPNKIIRSPAVDISTNPAVSAWYDTLKADYESLLRGKTLLQLLLRQLSSTARRAKHSYNSLLEVGAFRRGPKLRQVETAIRAYFT